MKLIKNTGSDRVIDELRQTLAPPSSLDVASPAFSLFAFAELGDLLEKLDACRVVLQANIAEGFRKQSGLDKARFLNISEGSLEECRYYVILAHDLGYLNPLRVHSPRLAASSSYRRKPVSRGSDWIPCQARNDGPE
ncbi:MAG: four helix bundle protein [candidate division NC10 bacterium]|nr:four helix bundle protein [candidate division NC10 bacterium]MDE2320948.1 four helix bundle protein [candidate division NC10 bacterium]